MATEPKESQDKKGKQRDRSPAFPIISLRTAIERLAEFDKAFGRFQTPVTKVGLAWGMKDNGSQAGQTLAALKYFGLVQYEGSGDTRKAFITEAARKYLQTQQEVNKLKMLKEFALNPKEIAKFWGLWGEPRPHDAVCSDALVVESAYNKNAAPLFLKVYDDTIAFAGLKTSDKISIVEQEEEPDGDGLDMLPPDKIREERVPPVPPAAKGVIKMLENERELTTGLLSKAAGFRLIVNGHVGKKEIDTLIKKLELDRDILGDTDEDEAATSSNG